MRSGHCEFETNRLDVLRGLNILDTPQETQFESIIDLIRRVFEAPICAISLVDEDRQWFKARRGLDVCQTSRDVAFCQYTILTQDPLVITDTLRDQRFACNPLVTGKPFIRSYAGVPLSSSKGHNVGSLCVMDTIARHFDVSDTAILRDFAKLVMDLLEQRVARTQR